MTWFRRAAEQGDAMAEFNLGLMHARGDGVTQNYHQALDWYFKAAEQGYPEAQYWVGMAYAGWQAVLPLDLSVAVKWWRQAAQQGHSEAIRQLEKLKEPVCRDHEDPDSDLKLAAKFGSARAQYLVGVRYEGGLDGFPQDLVEAYKFFRLAETTLSCKRIENVDDFENQLPRLVPQALQRVKSAMTSAQIAESERRALAFFKRGS